MEKKMKSFVSDLLFYGVLIALVVTVLAVNGRGNAGPRVIGGYSAFVVLTGSMEDVIPKGSLVITKHVDPKELEVGDDITYMVSEKTTVTHRIIRIEEEYLNTGERAFTTKGTMNAEADRMPVAAVNVVGKVIYHSERLGGLISFGQENWPLIVFFIVVALIFLKILGNILGSEEPKPADAEAKEVKEPKKANASNIQTEQKDRKTQDDEFVLEIIEL